MMDQIRNFASIITIGTEITDGEIMNSNASWLSEKVIDLGWEIKCHLSVADEREDIAWALSEAQKKCRLLVLSGGLGPTSDDFTREVVAEWSQRPLVLDLDSLKILTEKLQSRNIPVRKSHERECYFPQGSVRLANPIGTAEGFVLAAPDQNSMLVLPGPPKEIEGLWQNSLDQLQKMLGRGKRETLRTWTCYGAPESEIAELVEPLVGGSGLRVGYRATVPFVKVKVWFPIEEFHPLVDKISEVLSPWVVFIDPLETLLRKCSIRPIHLVDGVSHGYLSDRLGKMTKLAEDFFEGLFLTTQFGDLSQEIPLVDGIQFGVRERSDGEVSAWMATIDSRSERCLQLPFQLKSGSTRRRIYAIEEAIRVWEALLQGL